MPDRLRPCGYIRDMVERVAAEALGAVLEEESFEGHI